MGLLHLVVHDLRITYIHLYIYRYMGIWGLFFKTSNTCTQDPSVTTFLTTTFSLDLLVDTSGQHGITTKTLGNRTTSRELSEYYSTNLADSTQV